MTTSEKVTPMNYRPSATITQETYADLEIRILELQGESYPVEITLDDEQEFPRGSLRAEGLPWVPGISPIKDGERLFEWLFADTALKTVWTKVRGRWPLRRIRLRIDATAPELHAIPWELLRDAETDPIPQDLAAAVATPFSRYLAGSWPPGRPIQKRPLKILVAISNPEGLANYDLASLDVEAEWSAIQKAAADPNIEAVLVLQPCTLSALEAELRQGYHILHFVGHGRYSGEDEPAALFLADQQNQIAIVDEDDFATMLARCRTNVKVQGGDQLRLVFLASCQTATRSPADAFRGFAPALIAAGVPAVMAMQDRVPITTARNFTRTFYRQLLQHGLVDLASNEARATLLTGDFPGSSIPVLFSRLIDNQLLANHGLVEKPISSYKKPAPKTVQPVNPFASKRPARGKRFFGRRDLLKEIFDCIDRQQSVSLIGEQRTGKTSILLRVLDLREQFLRQPDQHVFALLNFEGRRFSSETEIWHTLLKALWDKMESAGLESEILVRTIGKLQPDQDALLRLFRTLARDGIKVTLLLDEFEAMARENALVFLSSCKIFRHLATDRKAGLTYIVATRQSLSAFEKSLQQQQTPAEPAFFDFLHPLFVPPFSADEAEEMVSGLLQDVDLGRRTISRFWQERDFLFELSGFHPSFLQRACYYLFKHCILASRTFSDSVPKEKITAAYSSEARSDFDFYWDLSSMPEQWLMRQLAVATGSATLQSHGLDMKSLENRCLVVREMGAQAGWRLFSTAFARWIEENHSGSQEVSETNTSKVLLALYQAHRERAGERVDSEHIRERIGLTRSQMMDAIFAFEERELVKVTFDDNRVLLNLTPKGVAGLRL